MAEKKSMGKQILGAAEIKRSLVRIAHETGRNLVCRLLLEKKNPIPNVGSLQHKNQIHC